MPNSVLLFRGLPPGCRNRSWRAPANGVTQAALAVQSVTMMRLHWLIVAAKFILIAVLLKLVFALLVLPLFLVDFRAAPRYWRSLFRRTPA